MNFTLSLTIIFFIFTFLIVGVNSACKENDPDDCYTLQTLILPERVEFFQPEQNLTLIGRLFIPPLRERSYPTIIALHGSGGLYKSDDPDEIEEQNFRKWADFAILNNFTILFIDSFTPRDYPGSGSKPSSETDRPFDVYAGFKFLTTNATYSGYVDENNMFLLGWSHGAQTILSSLPSPNNETNEWQSTHCFDQNMCFKAAVAMYPGCGLQNAFGGISKSEFTPYAKLRILHAELDPLYTSGYCETRINRARLLGISEDMWSIIVYPNASHSFDEANRGAPYNSWTQYDIDARIAADQYTLDFFNSCIDQTETITGTDTDTVIDTQTVTATQTDTETGISNQTETSITTEISNQNTTNENQSQTQSSSASTSSEDIAQTSTSNTNQNQINNDSSFEEEEDINSGSLKLKFFSFSVLFFVDFFFHQ